MLVKEPGKSAEVREVNPELETWQGIVGGYIELVYTLDGQNLPMYINEEGKLEELPPNITYGTNDYIAGVLVIFGDDGEGGERSLTDEEVRTAMEWLDRVHIAHV